MYPEKSIPTILVCLVYMNPDTRYNELLSKINDLSGELNDCREELNFLKNEIENLKGNHRLARPANPPNSRPTAPSATLENFIGLNVIHFVGIIVLIIGLTIGVKYAIDINLISPALRIVFAYLAGIGLFIISLRVRKNYEPFSMVIFSGAMASVYFTTYAAFSYYGMLSRPVAFAMMFLFTIFTVFNSLKYNKQAIAILGLVGAYGIPFFIRGNTDNLWALFSYIFLINTGILFLSLRRYWLNLNYLSFITTWIILFASLNIYHTTNYFSPQSLFSLLFFILFMVSSLGFKIYRHREITNADSFIVIINSLCLYVSLLILFSGKSTDFSQPVTMLFGVLYLGIAIIARKFLITQKSLHDALFSISLVAFVLYFFIRYEGLTVTIICGLLAIIYFICGMWLKLKVFRLGAIVLFASTLTKLVVIDSVDFAAVEKIIAYIFTGTVLLIVSFLYQKFKKRIFSDAAEPVNGDM